MCLPIKYGSIQLQRQIGLAFTISNPSAVLEIWELQETKRRVPKIKHRQIIKSGHKSFTS